VTNDYLITEFRVKKTKSSLMIPRGNCTFSDKTIWANEIGADLLIIYDSNAELKDLDITPTGSTSSAVKTSTIWISLSAAKKIN
jgi:hypothetical protein